MCLFLYRRTVCGSKEYICICTYLGKINQNRKYIHHFEIVFEVSEMSSSLGELSKGTSQHDESSDEKLSQFFALLGFLDLNFTSLDYLSHRLMQKGHHYFYFIFYYGVLAIGCSNSRLLRVEVMILDFPG